MTTVIIPNRGRVESERQPAPCSTSPVVASAPTAAMQSRITFGSGYLVLYLDPR
jgi:hypothetical protein